MFVLEVEKEHFPSWKWEKQSSFVSVAGEKVIQDVGEVVDVPGYGRDGGCFTV